MTPESTDNPIADYEARLEEHEFLKREGISAWADMMLEMLGDKVDPDKRVLIKEGLTNMLAGPPKFPMPTGIPAIPVNMPPTPPSAFFREEDGDGAVRLWDWRLVAANATHSYRSPSGDVTLYSYDDELIRLTGEAAAKYWEWQEAIAAIPFHWGAPIR